MGKLLKGSEAYVLETREVGATRRSLITASAAPTASPLGWVTAVREDGIVLLNGSPHGATASSRRAAPQSVPMGAFFTSFKQYTQATVASGGLQRLSWLGAANGTNSRANEDAEIDVDADMDMDL